MDNCDVVRRFAKEAWDSGDRAVVDEVVHPEAVPPPGYDEPGPASWHAYIDHVRAAFTDYETTIDDIFGHDDLVAVRWSASGRHTGDLLGFPASGKRIRFTAVGMARLRDGQLVEYQGETMMLQLMEQIGASPA